MSSKRWHAEYPHYHGTIVRFPSMKYLMSSSVTAAFFYSREEVH